MNPGTSPNGLRYLYDSRHSEPEQRERLARVQHHPHIQVVDTANWTDERRTAVYFDELLLRSVVRRRLLRGMVRTHRAGNVFFFHGVLVTADDVFVGEDVDRFLEAQDR